MTKYLEYDYEDDDGNTVHVKEPRSPEQPDKPKSSTGGFWIVFIVGVLAWFFIINPLMKSCSAATNDVQQQYDKTKQVQQQWKDYSDCLSDHMTDGRSYLCDGMKP